MSWKRLRGSGRSFLRSCAIGSSSRFRSCGNARRACCASLPARAQWVASLEEMEPFCGVHFSNELLDAMPVHLLKAAGDNEARRWRERLVERTSCGFTFVDRPISDPRLRRAAGENSASAAGRLRDGIEPGGARLDRGTRGQVAPRRGPDRRTTGWPRPEYYATSRRTGTLQCYAKHRVLPSPLENIGLMRHHHACRMDQPGGTRGRMRSTHRRLYRSASFYHRTAFEPSRARYRRARRKAAPCRP